MISIGGISRQHVSLVVSGEWALAGENMLEERDELGAGYSAVQDHLRDVVRHDLANSRRVLRNDLFLGSLLPGRTLGPFAL
ncbi:MAG: hypothetical protein ABIO86_08235 [Sphingomonas sp.]